MLAQSFLSLRLSAVLLREYFFFTKPLSDCRETNEQQPVRFENRCVPLNIFGWPEIEKGSAHLLHQKSPTGPDSLGHSVTHFTCAKCTNCVRDPK